jgi:hypothetical protein
LGGTVGDVTLMVSHEPWLTETMQVRVTLHRLDSGEYEIREVEHDLIVLSEFVHPSFMQIGWIWPDSSIPVPIQINANTGDIAGTGERQPVIDAITTWSTVSGSKFNFQSTNSSCAPIVRDNINCVVWQSGPGPGNAIGQTFLWASGSTTLVLVEADIVFFEQNANGSIQWSTSPSGNQIDVESVALHEFGHALGLDHSSAGTVMAPSILMGTTVRTLHSDDINGIRALYPAAQATNAYVASNGSATGACTPNDKCSTVARGANQVGDNGTVWITAGTYPETITINRPMTLDSPGGTVTIGN